MAHVWSHPELARCLVGGDVGALAGTKLAKQNPLAPGVYWLDVFSPSIAAPQTPNGELVMRGWLQANTNAVRVTTREEHAEGTLTPPSSPGAFPWLTGPATVSGAPYRYFYVFQVLSTPLPFPFAVLGYPTISKLAPPEQVTSADTTITSDDVIQKPPPQPLFDFGPLVDALETAGLVAGGILGLYLLVQATK